MALHIIGRLPDIAAFGGGVTRIITPDPNKKSYYADRYQKYLKAYEQST
jgi:hypothetical protein